MLALLGAFGTWGVLPLYLRALASVPSLDIVMSRLLFGCVFVLGWLSLRGELGQVRAALAAPATRKWLALTATLISISWLVYVWAVGHGRVVESSLRYFICPARCALGHFANRGS